MIMAANLDNIPKIDNCVGGEFVPPASGEYVDVTNPSTGAVIAKVGLSNAADVDKAVQAAQTAFPKWSSMTIKARVAIMLQFHALIKQHADELADLIVEENGKNKTEALADVAKGNETVEYACSLPQLAQGKCLQVSGQVYCQDERRPLGVVASIVPFNFPFMVPMWTFPIAVTMGNTMVLKPSEKVPRTMRRVAELIEKAGFPPGVLNLVQGAKDAVQAICNHDLVKAVTFVGSSPVAKIVADTCAGKKRCLALGGAKNHLIALPDCNVEQAASDIVVSFAGCAGQRCMAASVLLVVGDDVPSELMDTIVGKAKAIQPGTGPGQMGPVIDSASYEKITKYIKAAADAGAKVLVDGREWTRERGDNGTKGGNWIGPTVLLHSSSKDATICEEVFGPVLSVYQCKDRDQAIAIENANPFGNAASIYTTCGAHAQWFTSRFCASMLGVNIGIPVPREPFSFGGLAGTRSKYGNVMDITGDGGMEFFSNRIKVTSKWVDPTSTKKRKAEDAPEQKDQANFAGTM